MSEEAAIAVFAVAIQALGMLFLVTLAVRLGLWTKAVWPCPFEMLGHCF